MRAKVVAAKAADPAPDRMAAPDECRGRVGESERQERQRVEDRRRVGEPEERGDGDRKEQVAEGRPFDIVQSAGRRAKQIDAPQRCRRAEREERTESDAAEQEDRPDAIEKPGKRQGDESAADVCALATRLWTEDRARAQPSRADENDRLRDEHRRHDADDGHRRRRRGRCDGRGADHRRISSITNRA
jgi:hypothetical protein